MVVVVSGKSKLTMAEEAQAHASAMVEEQYQNFDVVWAKLGSFPWWPGVLFYSWDAVIEAGLELKQVQHQLVIPPPTTQVMPDGKQRTTYSVLIMYLDKFDCSVVEVTPKTVCPFAINYHRLKDRPKGKNGTGFNVALERAVRLLHMNNHMTLEELDAIAPIRVQSTEEELVESPSQQQLAVRHGGGKRQKRAHTSHTAAANDLAEDEDGEDDVGEDDDEDDVDFGSDYTDDEDRAEPSASRATKSRKKSSRTVAVPKAVSKKASAKSPQRVLDLSAGGKKASVARGKHATKRKPAHHGEAIDDDEDDDSDFEIVNTSLKAAAKPTSNRKKASRKEGRIHHDVINVDEDDEDEELDSSDGDFHISIAHPSTKKGRSAPAKVKTPKLSKIKPDDDELVVLVPAKLKKNKTKPIQLDPEVEVTPAAKPAKKRVPKPKRQSHDDHDGPHEQRVKIVSRKVESSPVQPLTLTPLSTIWTMRESSNTPADDKLNAENFARLAYKLDLLWDEAIFTDETPRSVSDVELPDAGDTTSGTAIVNNERGVGKRQVRSVQQSQIRQSMLTGNLDPHTMVQCEAYLPKGGVPDTSNSRSRGAAPQIEAPFDVVVHPDVAFVCDLHSHLATCEIIGFLGGRWDDVAKTLYIQAAFPCRSLEIEGDDGSTDVEMDPGSEIELREIIQNAELEVVGWYHSHPAFAPDPSIRDIENQTSYQQLFQRTKQLDGGKTEISYPFVGLIVGTYDQRRESPVGLFRYFHTREERLNSGMRGAVHMPYELVPRKRHYRSVLEGAKQEQLRRLPLYISVAETLFGADKAVFVKSPRLPNDEADMRARHNKPAKNANVAVDGRKKKRKGSSDLAPVDPNESAPPPVKKKRGRPKGWKKALVAAAEFVQADAAPDVIDLVTDASQELSQSQEQVTRMTPTGGDSTKNSSVIDPGGIVYSGGARSESLESVKGMPVKMPGGHGQISSVLPTDISPGIADDVVMVDESNQSQSKVDYREAPQSHRDDDTAIAEPDGDAPRLLTKTLSSDEVICDSSQSQDTASIYCADAGRADESLKNDSSLSRLVTKNDDVIPASASSSSSRSESSFSYDASQSQTISQSQTSSHPEDVATADESVKTIEADDDPFAGIEVLPNEPSSSSVVPIEVFSKHVDPVKVANIAPTEIQVSKTAASAGVVEHFSSKKNEVLIAAKDQAIAMQDDEVVGDSGPDTTIQSIPGGEETKVDTAATADRDRPGGDESAVGENATSGGSTLVEGSSSAGRRRTRKPSLTVRRHSGAGASLGRTNASPRSSGGAAKRKDGGDGEMMGWYGSKIRSHGEDVASTMDGTALAATERKVAVDSAWDDVEIISEDYMDFSLPTKPETTLPKSVESVVEITESEALKDVKSEVSSTSISPVEVMHRTEADVDQKLTETQPKEIVAVNHESIKVEGYVPEALPAPQHKSHPAEASSSIPGAAMGEKTEPAVGEKVEPQEVRNSPVPGDRGRRSKNIDAVDDAGFLVEPLERCPAKRLRSVMTQMGLMKGMASKDRNKEGYIAAIRAHWHELRHQPSSDVQYVNGGPTESLSPSKAISETVDEINGVIILDEAKEVVRALVSNVEFLVVDGAPSSTPPTQSNPGALKGEESAANKIDGTESSTSKPIETNSATVLVAKPEPIDPAQVVVPARSIVSLTLQPPVTKPTAPPTLQDRHAMHLQHLRTKYTRGVYGCTEQVITLIDYYRDFHRRTDLHEVWKAKVLKVDKIKASLRADVEHVNLPVALRDAFIKDVMGYLRASWKISRPMK